MAMATEIRHIILNDAELVRAAATYRRRRGQPLPPGMVRTLETSAGEIMRLKLVIEDIHHGKTRDVYLEGDDLGAALVMFCIHNGIPLPATGATKALEMKDGRLVLTVTKKFDVDASPAAASTGT